MQTVVHQICLQTCRATWCRGGGATCGGEDEEDDLALRMVLSPPLLRLRPVRFFDAEACEPHHGARLACALPTSPDLRLDPSGSPLPKSFRTPFGGRLAGVAWNQFR
jgi:hypothetical protein